ncbi:MAG: branched-chain amino acid transport system permease protein livM, partial [Acidimicrobiaceae bacterium]|nr:branched-chain amino acid transport system permease protein livM [Acidimicrobiaceae bacterium]
MSQFLGYVAIGISQGLVYALLALGIVLIYKGSRIVNFAHPYFGLLAAFVCWWLTDRAGFMPFAGGTRPRFLLAALITVALIALNGFSIEHSIMRRLRGGPRLVTLVATIALAQGMVGIVLLLFARNFESFNTFRSLPTVLPWHFSVGTRVVTGADIQVLLIVPLICAALAGFFRFSKFGVAVRAAAENGDAARLLGVSVDRVSQFTWVTGSVLAALAGILITEVRGSLDVASLSTGFLVRGLAVALVGGLTSLSGAVAGGLIVGLAEAMIQWLSGAGKPLEFVGGGGPELLLFIVVVAFLILKPGGLFGEREETEDKVAFVPTLRELPVRLQGTMAAKAVRVMGYAMLTVVLLIPLTTGPKTTGTLVLVTVFGMVGVSLTVLMGYSGQISLGHWGLVGVGAFAAANLFTRLHIPYLLTMVLTVLIGMAVSLVIGLPALRIRGLYLAIVTLSFNLACEYWLFKTHFLAQGTSGVFINGPKLGPLNLDDNSNRPIFYFAVICLLLSIVVARNLARSGTGRGFFALRENEKAAATLGVHLTRYRLLSFAVSGGIAALAGAVYGTYNGIVQSEQFGTGVSLVLVAMVMIGGLGALSGGPLGALLVFGVPSFLDFAIDCVVSIG